jgi:hypothetical protein
VSLAIVVVVVVVVVRLVLVALKFSIASMLFVALLVKATLPPLLLLARSIVERARAFGLSSALLLAATAVELSGTVLVLYDAVPVLCDAGLVLYDAVSTTLPALRSALLPPFASLTPPPALIDLSGRGANANCSFLSPASPKMLFQLIIDGLQFLSL